MPRSRVTCTTPGCTNETPALAPLCVECDVTQYQPMTKTKTTPGPKATSQDVPDSLDVADVDLFIDGLTRILTAAERGRQAQGAGLELPAIEVLQVEEDKRKFRDVFLDLARKMNDA